MSYEPDDFDWTSQVCLAWIQHFQKKGPVDVDDLKQAFADIANAFEQNFEEEGQEEMGDSTSRIITLHNISSASTWG